MWRPKIEVQSKRRSRGRRFADTLIRALALSYLLLLCFPQLVFAHSLTYRYFRVYSAAPLGSDIRPILDQADQRLNQCEINEPRAVHRVFLCPSHAAYAFFAPSAHSAFADNLPFLHNIFVNTADVAHDTVTRGNDRHNQRSLSGVIAHECTHTLLADRFGQFTMLRQPSWKQEGYCDSVAGSTSFDSIEGKRLLTQGRTDSSPSFFYFQAFTAVLFLQHQRHWSTAQIMNTPLSLDAVLRDALSNQR